MTNKQNPQDPSQVEPALPGPPGQKPKLGSKAWRDVLLYGFLRLVLFLVLTFVIHSIVILLGMANFFPLLMSALLALILALPLSMMMFKNLRLRVTAQMAEWDSARREQAPAAGAAAGPPARLEQRGSAGASGADSAAGAAQVSAQRGSSVGVN